jgi:hypothetical protein
MPKKPLSERVKSQKQSKLKEERILAAVDAYKAEQAKPCPHKEYAPLQRNMELKNATKQ